MIHRRTFLQQVVLASAAVALRPNCVAAFVKASLGGRGGATIDGLTCAHFEPLRGKTFTVGLSGKPTQPVVLTKVQEFHRDARIENFVLHFEGDANSSLTDGIHRFSHPELGSFEFFLAARSSGTTACHYEVIFNRLLS